ncbi:hypothetical protein AB833_15610 [Chromatiales bacterium (ex Bugula neritina AB1)]|nr:hypothetical protein AB833_15610 [Chromatiales bacterium (ex Bugula neritina AB1)]
MRETTTAVLLAAGRGKRLRPHTDHTPKPLLPWQRRPTLDWILDSLQSAGVSRIVLVTGHLEAQVRAYAVSRMKSNTTQEIHCTVQPTLDGTAGAVSCALKDKPQWFNDDNFLVTATDYLIAPGFYPELLNFHQQHTADISISLKSVPESELGSRSSVAYHGDFEISEVVEKPAAGTAPSPYSANLIYILPAALIELVHEARPSVRGEKEIQSAVNAYLSNGGTAKGVLQATPDEWTPALLN